MEREVSEVDRKLLLKKTYLDKINYHITRNPLSQDELYPLVRRFFGEYLKLDYEFTYEELSVELNKVFIRPKIKEHIDDFLVRLSESEYLEENSLGSKEINAFLSELADLIMNIISEEQQASKEDVSIISKMLRKSRHDNSETEINRMNSMIDELNFHISSSNLESSKRLYVDLLKAFDQLPKADKKRLNESMNDVYERLQSLMKNPRPQATQSDIQTSAKTTQIEQGSQINVSPLNASALNASPLIDEQQKKVLSLIEDIDFYVNASNLDMAKKAYMQALSGYDLLKKEIKAQVHPHLSESYEKLQILIAKGPSNAPVNKTPIEDNDTNASKSNDNPMLNIDIQKVVKDQDTADSPMLNLIGDSQNALERSPSGNTILGINGDSTNDMPNEPKDSINAQAQSFDYTLAPQDSENDEDIEAFRRPISEDAGTALNEVIGDGRLAGELDSVKTSDPSKSKRDAQSKKDETREDIVVGTDAVEIQGQSNGNVLFIVSNDQSSSNSSAKSEIADKRQVPNPALQNPVNTDFNASPGSNIIMIGNETDAIAGLNNQIAQPMESDISIKSETAPADGKAAATISSKSEIDSESLRKVRSLIAKIHDDLVMERLDNAKKSYKEALLLYRGLSDKDKRYCYNEFHSTFIDLDTALHKDSLNNILQSHLSESKKSNRAVVANPKSEETKIIEETKIDDGKIGSVPVESKKEEISNWKLPQTTLPSLVFSDENTERVYELIEQSYFNIYNDHHDLAMLKYFKALELYKLLSIQDKKRAYYDLYDLFRKISQIKNISTDLPITEL